MPNPGVPFTCAADPTAPAWSAGGIEGTGFGPARKRANLMVAGQTWNIDRASVLLNGQPATSAQIVDGLVTTVQGTLTTESSGTADTVVSESRVAGPIASVDATGTNLVVLGQHVVLTQDTQMSSAAALVVGDTVEVNALATAEGALVATRLVPREADLEYFVTGTVTALDDAKRTLVINSLTVEYGGVALQGFPTGTVHVGDLVRVFGRVAAGSTVLSARAVEFRQATPPGNAGTHIALYGYITRLASNVDFDVDGVPITTSAATDIEPPGPLVLDQVVFVCGTLAGNERVTATEVDVTWDY
jgi:hypothetical protein